MQKRDQLFLSELCFYRCSSEITRLQCRIFSFYPSLCASYITSIHFMTLMLHTSSPDTVTRLSECRRKHLRPKSSAPNEKLCTVRILQLKTTPTLPMLACQRCSPSSCSECQGCHTEACHLLSQLILQ